VVDARIEQTGVDFLRCTVSEAVASEQRPNSGAFCSGSASGSPSSSATFFELTIIVTAF
jgi:hypothetical protein